ncbi:MAG: SURF1 family protein [Alphaproteobacteria bacterium]|nr:SURF1 family protein [Alphaproteobacteria bacterium]
MGLGVWQLDRREWKQELIDRAAARLAEPPLTAIAGIGPGDAWRRVRLSGAWEAPELLLQSRTWSGRVGFDVLASFRPSGAAVSVLVNRGWVEPARRAPDTRPPPPAALEGVVRFPSEPGRFAVDNNPARGMWFHIDPKAATAHLGRPLVPFYIQAAPATAAPNAANVANGGVSAAAAPDWPRARPPEPRFRNDHLQYALTWFALAGAVAILYLVWRRRAGKERPE